MKTVIHNLAMVRLDVSIWGARARLNREDLKDASALPPQAMATLGSKKLFDPAQLRVFNTLKARAVRWLDMNGTRFLGGWATDIQKLPAVNVELDVIRREFEQAADAFFMGYDTGVREWADNFPEYRGVLLAAVPTLTGLKRKFNFSWQTFQIEPIGATTAGNNLDDTLHNIDNTAMQEVAEVIKDIYENTFKGRDTVTRKQFRPFNALFSKLDAISFIHPNFASLKNLLESIVNGYMDRGNDTTFVATLSALLAAMSTPDGVRAVVEPYADGIKTASSTLEDFIPSFDVPVTASVPNVVCSEGDDAEDIGVGLLGDTLDTIPAAPVAVEQAAFDDGGLW